MVSANSGVPTSSHSKSPQQKFFFAASSSPLLFVPCECVVESSIMSEVINDLQLEDVIEDLVDPAVCIKIIPVENVSKLEFELGNLE